MSDDIADDRVSGGGLDALRLALADMPSGPIPDSQSKAVEGLLAQAWHELDGAGAEGMAGWKVVGRTKELVWQPPHLSFAIDRHGALKFG